MSTDLNASFNEQYMNINTKLKKRFMRKPNISEATNEFIALAIQCEHSDQPSFAAHAYIGAAKCESTAGSYLGEAEHYLSAARQFMKAEKKLKSMNFFSPDRENLEASIGCYMQALSKYPEGSTLCTSILMELANDLVLLNHKLEAVTYYEQALQMTQETTTKLIMMCNLHNLQLECEKYECALNTANKISDSSLDIPDDILMEIQVNRILLALHAHPVENDQPNSLKKLLSDVINDCDNANELFNTDLRLKLQSIIMSCTTKDIQSLISVASETKLILTKIQNDLLDTIIRELRLKELALV